MGDVEDLIRRGGLVSMPGRRTQEEIDEQKRVQGMQVRSNAATVAAARYAGTEATDDQVLSLARVVADFIDNG